MKENKICKDCKLKNTCKIKSDTKAKIINCPFKIKEVKNEKNNP